MGMCLFLRTLSDRSIDRMLASPQLIWRVVLPEDPEVLADLDEAPKPRGFLARLFGGPAAAPTPRPDLGLATGEVVELDLGKAFHGVHFLLSGSAEAGDRPLDFLLVGGREVGDEDVGYGPGRVFRAREVCEIHDALRGWTAPELRRRFDPVRMNELDIYPSPWDTGSEREHDIALLIDAFVELQRFIHAATERKVGILITIE